MSSAPSTATARLPSTTSSPSASASATPATCGQNYTSDGYTYTVTCNTALTGAVLAPSTNSTNGTLAGCIAECDATTACQAVTLLGTSCILYGNVTGFSEVIGASVAYNVQRFVGVVGTASASGSTVVPPQSVYSSATVGAPSSAQTQPASVVPPGSVVTGFLTGGSSNGSSTAAPSTSAGSSSAAPSVSALATSLARSSVSPVSSSSVSSSRLSTSTKSSLHSISRSSTTISTVSSSISIRPSSTKITSSSTKSSLSSSKASSSTVLSHTSSSASHSSSIHSVASKSHSSSSSVSASPSALGYIPAYGNDYVKNKGKRGLSYTNDSYTLYYSQVGQDSQVSWGYNWYSEKYTSGDNSTFNPVVEFVPLLFNNVTSITDVWADNVQSALSQGATALMSFNEPDVCYPGSACMSINGSVAAYQKFMQPYAGFAQLGAPAVTNEGPPYGLTYLADFMGNCTNCTFDFVAVHWYSNIYAGVDYLRDFVESAYVQTGLPIWLTEFGLTDSNGVAPSEAQVESFLEEALDWLDGYDHVERYAYFYDGEGFLVNANGTGLSAQGLIYNSFNATAP